MKLIRSLIIFLRLHCIASGDAVSTIQTLHATMLVTCTGRISAKTVKCDWACEMSLISYNYFSFCRQTRNNVELIDAFHQVLAGQALATSVSELKQKSSNYSELKSTKLFRLIIELYSSASISQFLSTVSINCRIPLRNISTARLPSTAKARQTGGIVCKL